MSRIEEIRSLLKKGKMKEINELVKLELEENNNASEILNNGLLAGMDDIGVLWAEGKAFMPEVLIGARCMNMAITILEPYLVSNDDVIAKKVVFGTVKGDLHDIGKNLCVLMLKAKAFDVIDLGVDVDPNKFVEAIKEHHPDFVCLSSLLTTSMSNIEVTIQSICEAGLRDQVKIAVGGAPITQEYVNEVKADIFTKDAVTLANTLVQYS